jgi:hypothetical protein
LFFYIKGRTYELVLSFHSLWKWFKILPLGEKCPCEVALWWLLSELSCSVVLYILFLWSFPAFLLSFLCGWCDLFSTSYSFYCLLSANHCFHAKTMLLVCVLLGGNIGCSVVGSVPIFGWLAWSEDVNYVSCSVISLCVCFRP